MDLAKSYSFKSKDNVHVQISETPERESVKLYLTTAEGNMVSASLDKEMFDAFFDLRYKVEVNTPAEKEEVKV